VADIMSVLGAPLGTTAFSAKKTQNEPEGPSQDLDASSETAFNPILTQMIAAAQGIAPKNAPGTSTETVGDATKAAADEEKQGPVCMAFVSGEIMKMAGSVQGQAVLPTAVPTVPKVQSTMNLVVEGQSGGIGVAVNMAAPEGESAISIAKDPGNSPSLILSQQPESEIKSAGLKQPGAENSPAEAQAIKEPASTTAAASPSGPSPVDEIVQSMIQAGPNQIAVGLTQPVLGTPGPSQSAPSQDTNPIQGSVFDRETPSIAGLLNENRVQADTTDLKTLIRSFTVTPEAKPSATIQTDQAAAVPPTPGRADLPAVAPKIDQAVEADALSLLGSAVPANVEVVHNTSPKTAAAIVTNAEPARDLASVASRLVIPVAEPASAKASGAEVAANQDENVSPPQISAELLKLVQDKIGVARVMTGKPTVTSAQAALKAAAKDEAAPDSPDSDASVSSLDEATEMSDVNESGVFSTKDPVRQLAQLSRDGIAENGGGKARTIVTKTTSDSGATLPNTGSPIVAGTAGSTQQTNAGLKSDDQSGSKLPGTSTKVNAEASKRQIHSEPGESDKQEEQAVAAGKPEAKQPTEVKASVDPKGEPVTTIKEHAEVQRNQSLPVQNKVERHETVTPQLKQATLPPELLQSVPDQVAREISLKLLDKVSEMKLVLKPESLGEVSINVRMEEGAMVARINVNQNQVRSALEANLPQLRDALTSRGIQVDRIDVLTSSNSSSRESQSQSRDKSRGSSKRRADVEGVEAYESTRFLGYNTVEYLI
jgi:flagellar hook-length control protein FliK